MKRHHKSYSDGTLPRPSKYPFDGLPVDASAHIDSFSDARSKLRTAITSADALRIAKTRSPVAGQICLLVFKLLARWKAREWEGRPSRSPAYWWVGQNALLRGPSNRPPATVSEKADGSSQVDTVCMTDDYPALCVAFVQGLADYVAQRWQRHLQRSQAYGANSDTIVVFERPEDARSDRWEPPFPGNDCWRTGCCVAVVVPPRGEAYVTLAHASSLYVGLRRSVLLSPTQHGSALTAETAPEYVEFFLDRGTANCSVRYISLWQADSERPHDSPPLTGFRLFGTESTPSKSPNMPVRQFALVELKLNVDLHAISVPYRR